MKASTLEQLVREIIPLLGTTWVDNYEAKQDWIKRAQKALTIIISQPSVEETFELIAPDVFPANTSQPLVCHCETFEGDNWECERCGGGRF